MNVTVREVAQVIEEFAPLDLQEEYDNCGLSVGSWDTVVSSAVVCVDVTEAVLDEALALGANLIVSHHPLIFHPLRQIVEGDHVQRIVRRALCAGVSLYAAHTNLDSTPGGMSFHLGERLGLRKMRLLAPSAHHLTSGYGVVGEWAGGKISTLDFLGQVRDKLGCGAIRHSELCRKTVKTVALSTGAGASLLSDAIASGADLYLSADFRYNDFFLPDGRLVLADVGHFESEYGAIDLLYDIITKKITTFVTHKSEQSKNPVNYFL